MSEQGWRDFLAADGVADWVVLHGGACAVFTVASLQHGLRLATTIAEVPGLDESVLLTAGARTLTVRLTRELWGLDATHVAVAREISRRARELGARADRSAVREVQLAVAAKPAEVDVTFWRAVLGYDAAADDNAVDPLGHGPTVWLQELDEDKPLRHAMHVDVSVAKEHAEARVAAALAAGGTIVQDVHAPAAWILSDPAGNRVCIAAWPDGAELGTGSTATQ